jgi:hypothetical protein
MATIEGMRERERQKDIEEERQRKNMIEKFGETLGPALANYMKDSAANEERTAFASAVVAALETEDHESKVLAIRALLTGIEEKIERAKEEASRPMVF